MAVRETVTMGNLLLSSDTNITGNGATAGAIIDTHDSDAGLSFFIAATAFTDGTYKLTFEEGDDSGLSDTAAVPAAKLVETSALKAVTTGITAITADNDKLFKVGLHSTKRFVRATVNATGVTTGAQIAVYAQLMEEVLPAT